MTVKDTLLRALIAGALISPTAGCGNNEPEAPGTGWSVGEPDQGVDMAQDMAPDLHTPGCPDWSALERIDWERRWQEADTIDAPRTYLICAPSDTFTSCPDGASMDEATARKVLQSGPGGGFEGEDAFCGYDVRVTPLDVCGPVPAREDGCCYTMRLSFSQWCEGRPFVVEGQARLASVRQDDGWTGQAAVPVDALPSPLRARLAAMWAQSGSHEHASVASFAQFVMELMGAGAPRELVADAVQAMHDEIQHAADCFALASAWAGAPLGPDTLDTSHSSARTLDLGAILRATIIEGAVGEALAAFEAETRLLHTTDAATRAVLTRIAADEGAHAALAWRTAQWLLQRHPELWPVAQQAFDDARPTLVPSWAFGQTEADALLRPFGYISPAHQEQVRRRAYEAVVLPCLSALRSTTAPAERALHA